MVKYSGYSLPNYAKCQRPNNNHVECSHRGMQILYNKSVICWLSCKKHTGNPYSSWKQREHSLNRSFSQSLGLVSTRLINPSTKPNKTKVSFSCRTAVTGKEKWPTGTHNQRVQGLHGATN